MVVFGIIAYMTWKAIYIYYPYLELTDNLVLDSVFKWKTSPHMEGWCGGTAQTLPHWSCCSICSTAQHTVSGLHLIIQSEPMSRTTVNMHTCQFTVILRDWICGLFLWAKLAWFQVIWHTSQEEFVFYTLTVLLYELTIFIMYCNVMTLGPAFWRWEAQHPVQMFGGNIVNCLIFLFQI